MKGGLVGKIITEFFPLRTKMYGYKKIENLLIKK